jgi:predicted small metal-binding protein
MAERLRIVCTCGWNVEGERDEVIEPTRAHVLDVHWAEVDDEDILAMAEPI